jgi:lipopolysaccharide biosynthesis regulator YciM
VQRSYLVLERLDSLWEEQGEDERAAKLAERLLENDPKEWRAAIFLARRSLARGRTEEAVPWLRKAVERNPRSVEAHGLAWHLSLPGDPPELLKQLRSRFQQAGAFDEPYVCTACRYRTTDRLWRCPHCHRWDTFTGQHG